MGIKRAMKAVIFLVLVVSALRLMDILYPRITLTKSLTILPLQEIKQTHSKMEYSEIELTVRMSGTSKMIERLMCDVLRSAVLFWKIGNLHLILDKKDENSKLFPKRLSTLGISLNMRFTYEKDPNDVTAMTEVGKRIGKSYGYMLQLYSSFLMDLYTDAKIIAWIDTDIIFTQPVLKEAVIRNGKLVVKGMNSFNVISWLSSWESTNVNALGLPMPSDFMTYFPVYVYPSTIKHCREFIMKRFNVTNFENAFYLFTTGLVSPVSIIMSYAYYFERELYEWHIDIGDETIDNYNKDRLPNHPLTSTDILPELHVAVHSGYYKSTMHPLQQSICFIQINIGMNVSEICRNFLDKTNLQLFEFGLIPKQNHLETWCKAELRSTCNIIIEKQYKRINILYKEKRFTFNTSLITIIENIAQLEYAIECPKIDYVHINFVYKIFKKIVNAFKSLM